MDPSMISVILPVYKNKKFIDDAIKSITYNDECSYEIIAVVRDEGDDIFNYLTNHYASNHFRIILQNGKGYANAINIGYRSARGKYIAFQDADDISLPGRFTRELDILEKDDSVELVFSRAKTIDHKGNILSEFGGLEVGGLIPKHHAFRELFIHRNFIPNPTVMMRKRHVINNVLFDESVDYCNDIFHHLLLAKDWNIFQLDEPLVCIRRFSGHLNATSKIDENLKSLLYIYQEVKNIGLKEGIISEQHYKLAIANLYLFIAFQYLQNKRYQNAIKCCIHSIINNHNPFTDISFRKNMILRALTYI